MNGHNGGCKDCEEIKIVAFLNRGDIRVGLGPRGVVVHHNIWRFEGHGENVISAARAAMDAEERQKP